MFCVAQHSETVFKKHVIMDGLLSKNHLGKSLKILVKISRGLPKRSALRKLLDPNGKVPYGQAIRLCIHLALSLNMLRSSRAI